MEGVEFLGAAEPRQRVDCHGKTRSKTHELGEWDCDSRSRPPMAILALDYARHALLPCLDDQETKS